MRGHRSGMMVFMGFYGIWLCNAVAVIFMVWCVDFSGVSKSILKAIGMEMERYGIRVVVSFSMESAVYYILIMDLV